MAGIAAVVCAFLFRPSVLRAQGAAGAFKVMRELGFPNVLHLADGITKWKEAGFPTAR
jgi:rhodanese-related sulfurtransferase